MNTSNFLDANVWLALIWSRHEHGDSARAWFERAGEERVVFCRFTQLTVLRLLTTAAVMGDDVRTMSGAWEIWDEIGADERIAFMPEPDNIETHFRERSQLATASPKVWADAYLLAFSRAAGARLVTFDRALGGQAADGLVLN
jgi:toxin-antitoxin system PIN domain toxin